MAKKLLLLDCDGVIFDSNRLIDEQVQNIEFSASDKYCNYLNALQTECKSKLNALDMERPNESSDLKNKLKNEMAALEKLKDEHYYLKDMVLEEAKPVYQNRIDYYRIYRMENTFSGVIDKIREIVAMGIYDGVYIISHCNVDKEKNAKEEFFRRYLPGVTVFLMEFHKEKMSFTSEPAKKNKKRERTNKILEFTALTGIDDFSMTTFIDDSSSIIEEAEHLNVKRSIFKDKITATTELLERAIGYAIYDPEAIEDDIRTRRR